MSTPRKPKRVIKYYRLTKQRRLYALEILKGICRRLGAAEATITMYNEATGRRHRIGYKS